MAEKSFYEDMVIDTPEAVANLESLIDSGVYWTRGDTKFHYLTVDEIREMYARFKAREQGSDES